MEKPLTLIVSIACFLACMQTAQAHHSIAAQFNQQKTLSVQGQVVAFEFVNPHANLRLKAIDDQGNEEVWEIEMDGRLNLTNGNISVDTFTPGEWLTVTGFAPHIQSPHLFFLSAIREDGSVVLPPRGERRNSLEEERRQRRLEKEQNGND